MTPSLLSVDFFNLATYLFLALYLSGWSLFFFLHLSSATSLRNYSLLFSSPPALQLDFLFLSPADYTFPTIHLIVCSEFNLLDLVLSSLL